MGVGFGVGVELGVGDGVEFGTAYETSSSTRFPLLPYYRLSLQNNRRHPRSSL